MIQNEKKLDEIMKDVENNVRLGRRLFQFLAGAGILVGLLGVGSCSFHYTQFDERVKSLGIYNKINNVKKIEEVEWENKNVPDFVNIDEFPDYIVQFEDGTKKLYVHNGFSEYDIINKKLYSKNDKDD